MSPKIPVELAHAREQARAALDALSKAIANKAPRDEIMTHKAAAQIWREVAQNWHTRWEALGMPHVFSIAAAEQKKGR